MSSRPVPVVIASQSISFGGTERQLVEFAKAIDKTLYEPHVFCFIDDEARRAELSAHGVKVQVLPVRTFVGVATLKLAYSFASYLRKHKIQLFHSFDMPTAIFGAPVARFAGTPAVLTSCRGHRDLYQPKHLKLLQFSDRFAHRIVCNAEALATDLRSKGVAPELLRICHNGIDVARFPSVRSETGNGLTIGTICVLRFEKNIPLLLRAYAALKNRRGLSLRITGDGAEKQSLTALAQSLGLTAPEVTFHPAVKDVGPELGRIDIFVLPSFSEGLSNSVMEAMACGCTVAASAVGGNLELVNARKTGMLFDPTHVESLTAVLEELLSNAELRLSLAKAGCSYIREGFSMAASARKMEHIYRETLASVR